jgi:hypothetical protein
MPETQSESFIPSSGPWVLGPAEIARLKKVEAYRARVNSRAFEIYQASGGENRTCGDSLSDWHQAEYDLERRIERNQLKEFIDTMGRRVTEEKLRNLVLLRLSMFSVLKPSDVNEATHLGDIDLLKVMIGLLVFEELDLGVIQAPCDDAATFGDFMSAMVRQFRGQRLK